MLPHAHHSSNSSFTSWIPIILVLVVVLVYLYAIILDAKKNKFTSWPIWHTGGFLLGNCLLAIALVPSLAQWAHTDLRVHMVQHLLIGMYAPIFLVLGAPVTLALKSLPVKVARDVTAILRSKFSQVAGHPITALLLNIGGMYALYLTPFYNYILAKSYLHIILHIHFLVAGYLFTWSIIGLDPVPNRPGFSMRLSILFISIAAHAFLSKIMYAYLFPMNAPHPAEQIQAAAKLMYYWGDLSELLLTIAFFGLWYRDRSPVKVNPGAVIY